MNASAAHRRRPTWMVERRPEACRAAEAAEDGEGSIGKTRKRGEVAYGVILTPTQMKRVVPAVTTGVRVAVTVPELWLMDQSAGMSPAAET